MGRGIIAPLILNMELDGGEFSASRSSRFSTHGIGGWVCLGGGLDAGG